MDKTEIRVEFGNVSIGDQTARLGVKIARESLSLADGDRIFCGRRIWGKVILGEPGNPDQQRLPGMEDAQHEIEGAFDTKQLGVKPNDYSVGLTFNIQSIDISELAKFAKKSGVLQVVSVKDLDHEDSMDDEGWDHEMDREEEDGDDPHGDANRTAYTEGCEAATENKAKRCPYKKDDPRRGYWLRGYEETQQAGADMRSCSGCQTDYDGNAYDACPACGSTHFIRLETTEAE